jgi:cyanobactin cluster PatC/TenC/TruC protein
MNPDDKGKAVPETTWTLAEPHQGDDHLHATGLEDYGYWLRWSRSLAPRDPATAKPFRRGVVWR